jgi:hypothetical protein
VLGCNVQVVFRRRKQGSSGLGNGHLAGEQIAEGLRSQVLDLDPAEAGLDRFSTGRRVWGALLETGYPNGIATLVSLVDGTTSLYVSTGGGIIGGGAHDRVVAATQSFLTAVEDHLDLLSPDPGSDAPVEGRVIIRALTYQGRFRAEAAEDDLGHGRHPLSAVFYAGHGVLTELRTIDQARETGR